MYNEKNNSQVNKLAEKMDVTDLTEEEIESNRFYLRSKVHPVFSKIIIDMLVEKPNNVVIIK